MFFRIFYLFLFGCLFSLVFALLLCVFVSVLHVSYLFASFNDYDASSGSISFFHIHTNIGKDVNCLQSNNNVSSRNLWLLFSASSLFLNIWFSKSGNITLRLYVFLIVYLLLSLQKHIKNSDHQEPIRRCSRYEFFTSGFIDTCEDIQSLITQLTINHYSISKLKCQNLKSFSHLLLLFSGDISLNPGPVHQDTLECLNEWNVFKNRGLHFIHLNINSLLPKIDELCYIAKSTNPALIGICKSKLDASVLDPEISINNYKILRCDRNRQGGGVACYVRNDLSYNTISVFPREAENIFFEILLPNSKPITVGTIYRPPNQSKFLEILNDNMNKIDSANNEIYIFGDFNVNLYMNDSYILAKRNILNNKSVPSDDKSYQEFCTFFGLKQLIIVQQG